MGNWFSFSNDRDTEELSEDERLKLLEYTRTGIESFSENTTEESDSESDSLQVDRTRYAIITPKGVIKFWVDPNTLAIKYERKLDAYKKITELWITPDENEEVCTIEKDENGTMWFIVELSDGYYGCPMYYVWDTHDTRPIADCLNEFEVARVLNMV